MKEDDINLAISLYLGWKKGTVQRVYGQPDKFQDWGWTAPQDFLNSKSEFAKRYLEDLWSMDIPGPPDFYGDLNAMNLAELWLKKDDPHSYGCYVTDLMDGEADSISKSAAERAEMFVKIIGKWKGNKSP